MPLIENPRFREKLAAVEIELKALEMTQLRVVAAEGRREKGKPDPASSILKIKGSEIQQATTELLMEVVGPFALPYVPEERRSQRADRRTGLGDDRRADLLQLAQDLDLRRLERDSEEHHREGDPGFLKQRHSGGAKRRNGPGIAALGTVPSPSARRDDNKQG